MDYPSPTDGDYDEVRSLNEAFLALLAGPYRPAVLPDEKAAATIERLAGLDLKARSRLARAPFLLFSLREDDGDYWDRIHADAFAHDLFVPRNDTSTPYARLVSAAIGFVWQLSRQNAYTLRLVCCASLNWCEQIAEQPLLNVINRAAALEDILEVRASGNEALWHRLTTAGVSTRAELRRSTHRAALQTLLMRSGRPRPATWKSAACRSKLPQLHRAAEE